MPPFPAARVIAIPALPDPYSGAISGATLMLTDATVLPSGATGVFDPGSVGAAQQGAAGMTGVRYGGILVGQAGLAGISDLLTAEQRPRATDALDAGTAVVLRNAPAPQDAGSAQFDLTGLDLSAWDTRYCTNALLARYREGMSEMTVSDARARLADVVDAARVQHDPVYLTRRGQRVAAVIDAEDLDRLIAAAEDLADLEAARASREEMAGGQPAIPWEDVKADLGLA